MESPIIPDLHLDLLIKRTPQGQWSGVDVRFKGITYVSIKKHEFRQIIEQQGTKHFDQWRRINSWILTIGQRSGQEFI